MEMGQGVQQPPKIAEPVPLEKTDDARKATYGPIAAAREKELAEKGQAAPAPEQAAPEPPEEEKDPAEPNEDDKKAFLRSLLGEKPYEKTYATYGTTFEALFADRTTMETERLYEELEAAGKPKSDWGLWEERFLLASTLRKVKFKGHTAQEFDRTDKHEDRIKELMGHFSKPVYMALMEASRRFERQLRFLVSKAHDPDFWKADGEGSPSKRT